MDCPICLNHYTDSEGFHVPKVFPCGHTICEQCLVAITRGQARPDESELTNFLRAHHVVARNTWQDVQTVLQDGSSSTSDTGASDIEEMLQPPLKAGAAAGQAKAAAASESRRGASPNDGIQDPEVQPPNEALEQFREAKAWAG
ncbi:hypothetical protein AK812_SmicGene36940 [Symbiodinium microadriaticum]|uniref:RING-type domain-containing protein n=1 Tax=Symbiodinium microadriaticum TaxID=2951 RepID=A0A1Q9CHK7_SYMMI|nr:hypothetical protein AK812_SmicGene36940 [Symbiodinium microadriaticum]